MARGRGRRGARRAPVRSCCWPVRRASARPAWPSRGRGAGDALALRGAGGPAATPRTGPIMAALRWRPARAPGRARSAAAPSTAHLALLLPELAAPGGAAPPERPGDDVRGRARGARGGRSGRDLPGRPAVVGRGHAGPARGAGRAAAGAAAPRGRRLSDRRDRRGHPFRRLRASCAARMLRELVVNPLDTTATRELAAATLGARARRARRHVYDRTQGVPFSSKSSRWASRRAIGCARPGGLELGHDAEVPVPETIRDAVLLRTRADRRGSCRRRGRRCRRVRVPARWGPSDRRTARRRG